MNIYNMNSNEITLLLTPRRCGALVKELCGCPDAVCVVVMLRGVCIDQPL